MAADSNKSVFFLTFDHDIDRRVLDQGLSLASLGWSIKVTGWPRKEEQDPDQAAYPGLKIHRLTEAPPNLQGYVDADRLHYILSLLPMSDWTKGTSYTTSLLAEALLHKADVYVAVDLPTLAAGVIAALYHGSYLVYDAHELYPHQAYFHAVDQRKFILIERFLLPFADLTLTVNDSIARYLERDVLGNPPEVLLNLPRRQSQQKAQYSLREKLPVIPSSKKILLFQGGLAPKVRNLENLVASMSLLRRDDVVLVVMGPDSMHHVRKSLEEIATSGGTLNSTVFFLDPVPQSDLLSVTASADAGIIPYPAIDLNGLYCSPNKLFEYLSVGLPILANSSPELTNFVGNQGVGLNLPMSSAGDIAQAIDIFFSSDIVGFKRRANSLKDSFCWEFQHPKVLSLYTSLFTGECPPKSHHPELFSAVVHLRRSGQEPALDLLKATFKSNVSAA